MRTKTLLTLTAVLGMTRAAPAADFGRTDAPAKEPALASPPRYCLLAFGLEAKARVWVVVAGDAVYVDCNANGDLTEPGEKFALSKPQPIGVPPYTEQREVAGITVTD